MSSHKILLVDDDPHLTAIIQLLLERDGYDVAASANGADAYAAYLRHQSELVITDVWMPGMSGIELVQKIRAKNPNVKIIYMSGYSGSFSCAAMKEEKTKHRVVTLQKPFARMQLSNAVASCLDSR